MSRKKLKVGFLGARWLGVACLNLLSKRDDLEITHVCFPDKTKKVWWKKEFVDQEEVEKLGFKITSWNNWINLKFDLVFSILHGEIFKKEHLANSKLGIINLHAAPLPEYRGCNSYVHAIINGDKTYRVTLHYVDEDVDSGKIIDQESLSIYDTDTGRTLFERAQKEAYKVFKRSVPKILEKAKHGEFSPAFAQDETKAKYHRKNSLDNKEVDLNWDETRIYNFVRALDFPPFEPAYLVIGRKKIYSKRKILAFKRGMKRN